MAEDNFPNVQKCMLSVPAWQLGQQGDLVPDTDTITEDQWAPVVITHAHMFIMHVYVGWWIV